MPGNARHIRVPDAGDLPNALVTAARKNEDGRHKRPPKRSTVGKPIFHPNARVKTKTGKT